MARFNQFSSENVLMSVGGHLALAAIMVTSFIVVVDRARLVAPDRVEITEIDLSSVKVSGDETRLYNTAPAPDITDVDKNVTKSVPDAPKNTEAEDENAQVLIETPSLVNDATEKKDAPSDDKADDKKEPVKTDADKAQNASAVPATRKKTVVRVNRETVSLDRTLTISVVDALRVAMTRCWTIDTSRYDMSNIRAVAHLTMRQNGTVRDVWFEGAAAAETDPVFAYVLDTIRAAINVCQPFKMLPVSEFSKWEKIQLTFYPTQGKVM